MNKIPDIKFVELKSTNPHNYDKLQLPDSESVALLFLQLRYISEMTIFRGDYDWQATLDSDYLALDYSDFKTGYLEILSKCASICENSVKRIEVYQIFEELGILDYVKDIIHITFLHFRDKKSAGVELGNELINSRILFKFATE